MARQFDRPSTGNMATPAQIVRYFDKFLTALEGNLGALAEADAAMAAALAAAHTADWSGVNDDNAHKPEDNATLGADLGANVTNNNLDNITDSTTRKAFLATERTKLTGVEAGATLGADLASNVTNNSLDHVTDSSTRKALANLAVVTAYIANNAVTNPTSAYSAGSVTIPSSSTWTDLQTVTITTTGAPINVHAFFYAGLAEYGVTGDQSDGQYRIIRDSTVIFGPVNMSAYIDGVEVIGTGPNSALILDQPASGSHTYKLQGWADSAVITPTFRSLVIMEAKK